MPVYGCVNFVDIEVKARWAEVGFRNGSANHGHKQDLKD